MTELAKADDFSYHIPGSLEMEKGKSDDLGENYLGGDTAQWHKVPIW